MKANELMIGDWVYRNGKDEFMKVLTISEHGCCLGFTDGYCGEAEDLIEPIPLTPEILEKNGFIPNKFNINDVFGTRFDLGNNYYLTFYNSNRGGSLTKYYTSQSGFYITTIEYVHELQHALRLCGIEKEIEL